MYDPQTAVINAAVSAHIREHHRRSAFFARYIASAQTSSITLSTKNSVIPYRWIGLVSGAFYVFGIDSETRYGGMFGIGSKRDKLL